MLTYEYICKKCGDRQEVCHPINFDGQIKCRKCGKETERTISAPHFILKPGKSSWASKGYSDTRE